MGRRGVIFFSHSPEETFSLGQTIGKALPDGSVVCFFGDLAVGKTTFIKGLAAGAMEIPPSEINSPTFALLNIYAGKKTLYHFDLYRLKSAEEFFSLGFDEYLNSTGISCIEWSERIEAELPGKTLKIRMQISGENKRIITVEDEGHFEKI